MECRRTTIASASGKVKLCRVVVAGRAVATANLFQDARYFVALEDAGLNSYRITHLPVDLAAHGEAEASLGATLGQLAAREAGTSDASAVAQLIASHGRYLVLARQVAGLIGDGQVASADALETGRMSVENCGTVLSFNLAIAAMGRMCPTRSARRSARWFAVSPFALTFPADCVPALALRRDEASFSSVRVADLFTSPKTASLASRKFCTRRTALKTSA